MRKDYAPRSTIQRPGNGTGEGEDVVMTTFASPAITIRKKSHAQITIFISGCDEIFALFRNSVLLLPVILLPKDLHSPAASHHVS